MPPDLRAFIERSLSVLAEEAPAFSSRLCRTLSGRHVRVDGDDRPFTLGFTADAAVAADAKGSEDVQIHIDSRTILALVDGELSLEDALRTDRLEIIGAMTNVVDLFDGLMIYLHGAIRCPSLPSLLARFRASTIRLSHEVSS